ncbi:vanin-like protein 2 isoform X2 [Diachasma alloeum]|uniref:vanin-like protein 2 isoform X2 n=1 Tax=Diachasma alloeum TaxID=454923 RepID=UPI000738479C|nr:vanin-like protein 2 isoform X2 [Diachasma alloeum]
MNSFIDCIRMELPCICLLAVIQLSHQWSTPEADTYRAAVVEFNPQVSNTNSSPIDANSRRYVSFIQRAAASEVDIIVFPEDGLTTLDLPGREAMEPWSTLIPVDYNPCMRNDTAVHKALKRISCAAREGKMYVVINIAEKLPCDGERCPEDGKFLFNCQAVFDRDGKIIAKYRKTHLFDESQFDILQSPEVVTFDTDFNVTFGTFICFDMLFKEPALNLTRIHHVTDIVYSTAWFSELPFLTAIQAQSEWAYSEDVNFLASGYNRPHLASFGSGIYLGKKGIAKATIGARGDELLIADVPKKSRKLLTESIRASLRREFPVKTTEPRHDELRRKRSEQTELGVERDSNSPSDFNLWQDPGLPTYETRPINSIIRQEKLCQRDFCCDFTVETSRVDSSTRYRLTVVDGIRTFVHHTTIGYQACGVVLCGNDSINSCGLRMNSETTFTSVKITATFVNLENLLIFPNSVNSSLMPLDWTYSEKIEGDEVHIEAVLNERAKNVQTLGLYARKFERDVRPPPRALRNTSWSVAVAVQTLLFVLLLVASAALLWYYKCSGYKRGNEVTKDFQQINN